MKNITAVFDVDGVFSDGTFLQTKEGKFAKCFGPDDFDAIDELKKCITVHLITADKKGFDIVKKRMDEKSLSVEIVSNKPALRWAWMENRFHNNTIIYIGDGIYDWLPLQNADLGITTVDALDHIQANADYVSKRTGANRFVADACLYIMRHYELKDCQCLGL